MCQFPLRIMAKTQTIPLFVFEVVKKIFFTASLSSCHLELEPYKYVFITHLRGCMENRVYTADTSLRNNIY